MVDGEPAQISANRSQRMDIESARVTSKRFDSCSDKDSRDADERQQLRGLRVAPDHAGAGLLRGNGYASTSADK